MSIVVTLSQSGKPDKDVTVAEGTTVAKLLNEILVIPLGESSVMWNDRKIGKPYDIELADGDSVAVVDNNSGALVA